MLYSVKLANETAVVTAITGVLKVRITVEMFQKEVLYVHSV